MKAFAWLLFRCFNAWHQSLMRRRFFDGRQPARAREWLCRKALDRCEAVIYRGAFDRLEREIEVRERLARHIAKHTQETIANALLWWPPMSLQRKGGS